jgi:hypothetical protein
MVVILAWTARKFKFKKVIRNGKEAKVWPYEKLALLEEIYVILFSSLHIFILGQK